MTLLGGAGLAMMARISHANTQRTAAALAAVPGVSVLNSVYFNEFTVELPRNGGEVVRALADRGVLGGVSLGRLFPHAPELAQAMLVTATECTTEDDIAALVAALKGVLV